MSSANLIPKHLADAGFLSKKAGSFSQVPQRTVQLWTEKGLISPEVADTKGTGDRRQYSVLNCIEIAIIRSLSESRLSYKIIEQIMKFLQKHEVTKRPVDIEFGKKIKKWKKLSANRSNLSKLLDEESATLTISMLDNGKIKIFASGHSKIKSDFLNGYPIGVGHFIPSDYDNSEPIDCDKELSINLTRIAKKTINKIE